MKSPKEVSLDNRILGMLTGKAHNVADLMMSDPEIHYLQDYSNTVSIKRLGYNDHGPVHMRKVLINALKMSGLLQRRGIKLNLEEEGVGTHEDSTIALIVAALLHDVGMSIGRDRHEFNGAWIALPIIDRVLEQAYGNELEKRVIVRSLVVEGIVGHMATQKIHSLEAGLILIADGLDMEKGRARIPMLITTESRVGDIHKYSAAAIEKVTIGEGGEKPVKITVEMAAEVGFFQIEEVLFTKVNSSPIKPFIELYASVKNGEIKRYL